MKKATTLSSNLKNIWWEKQPGNPLAGKYTASPHVVSEHKETQRLGDKYQATWQNDMILNSALVLHKNATDQHLKQIGIMQK